MTTRKREFTLLPLGKEGDQRTIEAYYSDTRARLLDVAHAMRLSQLVLTAPQYLARYGHAYVPLPDPGIMPNAAVALQTWSIQTAAVRDLDDKTDEFKDMYLASLGPGPLRVAQDPDGTIGGVTITQILAREDAAYGVVTPQAIAENSAKMGSYVPSRSFDEHTNIYRDAIAFAIRVGQPFPAAETVERFLQSFRSVGVLTDIILFYNNSVPALADRNFEGCVRTLKTAEATLRTSTASAAGYHAAAATAAPAAAAISVADVTKIVADALAADRAAHKPAAQPARAPARAAATPAVPDTNWCWSCGKFRFRRRNPTQLGHTSAGCPEERRKPGHRADATERNKMGSPN